MRRRQKKVRNQGAQPPGRLRIVAGKWRGRVLPVTEAAGLRPTSARVRETLFNWLAPRIDGARCLDLFAGTGALGFEALSRGAAHCVFVEADRGAAAALRRSAAVLDTDAAEIVAADAFTWLSDSAGRYDVVFLDPPFAGDSIGELCRLLAEGDVVAPGGRVYFEQGRDQPVPELPAGWSIDRQKLAGQVRYSLAAVP